MNCRHFDLHKPKWHGIDVGRFENQQAAGLHPFRHRGNKSFGRVDVFDDVKTRHDVEVAPGQRLDHIAMNGSHVRGGCCKIGARLHAEHVECFAGHAQKISAGASHFQKFARRSKLPDQVEPPARIEQRQPVFFFQLKISNIGICRLHTFGHVGRNSSSGSECQLGLSPANVLKAAIPALHQRSIELWRHQNRPRIIGSAQIA